LDDHIRLRIHQNTTWQFSCCYIIPRQLASGNDQKMPSSAWRAMW
jgi:hypothetical protein